MQGGGHFSKARSVGEDIDEPPASADEQTLRGRGRPTIRSAAYEQIRNERYGILRSIPASPRRRTKVCMMTDRTRTLRHRALLARLLADDAMAGPLLRHSLLDLASSMEDEAERQSSVPERRQPRLAVAS